LASTGRELFTRPGGPAACRRQPLCRLVHRGVVRRLLSALALLAVGCAGCVNVAAQAPHPAVTPSTATARPMSLPEATPAPGREALVDTSDDSAPSATHRPAKKKPKAPVRPAAPRPRAVPPSPVHRVRPEPRLRVEHAAPRPRTVTPPRTRTAKKPSGRSYDMGTVCAMSKGNV